MPNASTAAVPAINLPAGGGAVSSIGESFHADPFTGTGTFAIPIAVSQGRGTAPALSLQYSSAYGNGPFGLGWRLNAPTIARRTDKGLPRYSLGSDTFLLSGFEELVPIGVAAIVRGDYDITRYEPRTGGAGLRAELWRSRSAPQRDCFWRILSRENESTIYGRTPAARLANPANIDEVFEWAIEETFDARGNHAFYEYVQDRAELRPSAPFEPARSFAQRYLRRILYAPTTEDAGPVRWATHERDPLSARRRRYLLEIGFDYGDGAPPAEERELRPADSEVPSAWPLRPDPFSTCRPRFEVRTLRRCSRIVMHHHFPELRGATLVKATSFAYRMEPHSGLSMLASVQVTGYRRDRATIHEASLPALSLRYSEFNPERQRHGPIEVAGSQYPTAPLSDPSMALVDLGARGLPDILQSDATGFRVWRNLGRGRFDRPRMMSNTPGVGLGQSGVKLTDVEGAGRASLTAYDAPVAGVFGTDGRKWTPLRRFRKRPSISPSDPDVILADLGGAGMPDLVESTPGTIRWYQALGIEGYGAPASVRRTHDLAQYPDLHLADPNGRVRLADMNGDGLPDVVLLHDGRIEYWPNLGFGRFGPRVTMSHGPRLGRDFDPSRLFLVDVDGSGTSDLVHVGFAEVRLYTNRSGNSWSDARVIRGTPRTSAITDVRAVDLTGSGTATLIWSEPLVRRDRANYRFLDLCGGVKPYVLVEAQNNMGASTRVRYGTSTSHMLRDEGTPSEWQTRLPMPVHVIDKVESMDFVSGVKRVSTFAYHHGFYDGSEREFRGFGSVDQVDSEDPVDFSSVDLHQTPAANATPPVWAPPRQSRSWFHTGAYFEDRELSERYRVDYYAGDARPLTTGGHRLDLGSRPRDTYRALRGLVLRTETYGLDGGPQQSHPYTSTEHSYIVRERHPATATTPPVLMTVPLETVTLHYERQPDDPRATQELTIAIDDHGGVVERIVASFPRRPPAPFPEQARTTAFLEWHRIANITDRPDEFFVGVVCEERRFEVTGLSFAWPTAPGAVRGFSAVDFAAVTGRPDRFDRAGAAPRPGLGKRLREWQRCYFRDPAGAGALDSPDTPTHRLPLGSIVAPALPYETMKAVFDERDIAEVIGESRASAHVGPALGYRRDRSSRQGDPARRYWWLSSGRQAFDASRFFIITQTADVFGHASSFEFDRYGLHLTAIVDPLQNRTSAVIDYRVLQPVEVTSPNGGRQQILFDALGFVAASAQMGRADEAAGNSLAGVEPDLSTARVREYFAAADSATALEIGRDSTTRYVYDLHRFADLGEPVALARIGRLDARSFVYFNGSGQEVQSRLVAHGTGSASGSVTLRWLATGAHLVNNKGQALRRHEPFYAVSHRFSLPSSQTASDTVFYDALGRPIGMLYANHTWEKTIVGPWKQELWERGDTVLVPDPSTDPDVGEFFANLPQADYLPSWHDSRASSNSAELRSIAAAASAQANSPTVIHVDSNGRSFLREDVMAGGVERLRCERDAVGLVLAVEDARGVAVCRQSFDLLERPLSTRSVDAGTRLTLPDAGGHIARAWDGRGTEIRAEVDELRRPTEVFTRHGDGAWRLLCRVIYGESAPAAFAGRLRQRPWQIFDSAGRIEHSEYDHRGHVRMSTRTFVDWDGNPVDWQRNPPLLPESLVTTFSRDALDRVSQTSITAGSSGPYLLKYRYGRDTLLQTVDVELPDGSTLPIVTGIEVNARGQRTSIAFGNGVTVRQSFEPGTLMVSSSVATRADGVQLQALRYEYDATGNLVVYDDAALAARLGVSTNSRSEYGYDARSRLIRATGRERASSGPCTYAPAAGNIGAPAIAPGQTLDLVEFEERYAYDPSGNLTRIDHTTSGGTWARVQAYEAASNRLINSDAGCTGESAFQFQYDANGNPRALPGGALLEWDGSDRLHRIALGSGASVMQAYDIQGARVRKRSLRSDGSQLDTSVVGELEIHAERRGSATTRRETLHVQVHGQRVALIETLDAQSAAPTIRPRYLLANHLKSCTIELDASGQVISSEEYFPYGGSAYIARQMPGDPQRFRFGGRELDAETGLYSWGARFYAPWLCRWLSPDPGDLAQLGAALDRPGRTNLYQAFQNNPITVTDPSGLAPLPAGSHASAVSYEGLNIALQVEHSPLHSFSKITTTIRGAEGVGILTTSYNPATGTLCAQVAENPWRGTGRASGLMQKLLAEQLSAYGVKASNLRVVTLDLVMHKETVDALAKGAKFSQTEMHAIVLRRAAELGIRLELQEVGALMTAPGGIPAISEVTYRVPGPGARLLSLLGMGTRIALGPGMAVAPVLWTAMTDDPKRAGQFHREPMFTPYANAELQEMKDTLARMEGFEDYDHFSSVLAFKAGCDDCMTIGELPVPGDFRQYSMKQLADMPFDYDADRAGQYLDAMAMKSPPYPTISAAPSR